MMVKELLERVLLNGDLEFRMSFSFIGMRVAEADSTDPASAEFLSGTPVFFDEMAMMVRHRSSRA